MIGGMMEIARGDEPIDDQIGDVQLDRVVAGAVEEASFHWPDVRFVTDLAACVVRGAGNRIERAVSNLLDNAGKWSPSGADVEVAVQDGEVSVRDHGPGIAADDVPFVFDRFWRAETARGHALDRHPRRRRHPRRGAFPRVMRSLSPLSERSARIDARYCARRARSASASASTKGSPATSTTTRWRRPVKRNGAR